MATTSLYEEGMQKFKKSVKDSGRVKSSKEISIYNEFIESQNTPQEARDACTKLSNTTARKYAGDKVNIPDTWVANIFNNIGTFISIGDYVMKKAPESVGTAWFGVSLALSAIQNNYALYSLFGSGLTDQVEMMITITHYDRLYDERNKPAFKSNELLTQLFDEISDTYAAMLDFSFTIQRHITGGAGARLRHAAKDFFGSEGAKFDGKIKAIAALKAKIVEKSQGVFQSKSAQRFDEVQDSVSGILTSVQDIKNFQSTSEEFYRSQLQQQQEILQTLNEVKASTKSRTRWDWAVLDYENVQKLLNPLKGAFKPLFDRLDQRLAGSGEWVFELDDYKEWLNAESSEMLCLTGQDGVGKSALMAGVWDSLNATLNQDKSAVLFLSCDMVIPGATGEDSPQALGRITNTLISQLYEFAKNDEEHVGLLEECTMIFRNPKDRSSNDALRLKGKRRDDRLPELTEGLLRLARILKRKVYIVLDGVDSMNEEDQLEIYNSLQDLSNDEDCQVLTFLGARTGTKLFERILDTGKPIEVERHNRPDIELLLETELSQLAGWTPGQRKEATEKILEKAGPFFKYVIQVALPFVREPFSGSVTRRLETLPGGIGDAYNHVLQNMGSNYIELLRTALSFNLFPADEDPTAREVMDFFSNVYIDPPSEEDLQHAEDEEEEAYTTASELQILQLKTAAGPFLDIREEDNGTYVGVKDETQLRNFCFPSSLERNDANPAHPDAVCARCQTSMNSAKRVNFSERDGHLEMAIRCVRHLCHPLYQRRFLSEPMWNSHEAEQAARDAKEIGSEEDLTQSETDEDDDENNENNEDNDRESNTSDDGSKNYTKVEKTDAIDAANENSKPEAAELASPAEESDYDSDESRDDDDWGLHTHNDYSDSESESDDESDDVEEFRMRYETIYWTDHVLQAERLWTPEERAASELWSVLFEELDRFATNHTHAFHVWQSIVFSEDDTFFFTIRKPFTPLHVAAYFGLTSWAKHLLDGGASVMERSDWITPIQAASLQSDSVPMLRLLLDHGASIDADLDKARPIYHSWIWKNDDPESVDLFYQHNVERGVRNIRRGWSELHYLADSGENPRTLELLVDENGPGDPPDINSISEDSVVDHDRETPLHILLWRREVPLALLEKFIELGADVNIDDADSRRPLQRAAAWGAEKIINILLPKVTDIDDDDRRGRTAIHEAAFGGHEGSVKILVEHGANINVLDKHNRTPLLFACLSKSLGTANFLLNTMLERGFSIVEINQATKRGRTPVRQAAGHGFTDIVARLLKLLQEHFGAEMVTAINKVDDLKQRSALHCAAINGHLECVRLLLDAGADPKLNDIDGRTALQMCSHVWPLTGSNSLEDVIELLIDADPCAIVRDSELSSAAAVNGSRRILEKLHQCGADLKRPDQFGWTPLMLAQELNRTEAIEYLTQQNKWDSVLPSRWVGTPSDVEVENNGLTLRYTTGKRRFSITTDRPLPAGLPRYYFEVTLKKIEELGDREVIEMAVGFATAQGSFIEYPGRYATSRAPTAKSWAYHGEDGSLWTSYDDNYREDDAPVFGDDDTVGCGIDVRSGEMWVTHNGELIETDYFKNVRGRLFPIVGFRHAVEIETNFGKEPFRWQGKAVVAEVEGKVDSPRKDEVEELTTV